MSNNSVDSDQYVDGSIDTVHLSADSVDDTKAGNRVPVLTDRQGGSAASWATVGAIDYVPTIVKMQCGAVNVPANPTVVTFPHTYDEAPVAFLQPLSSPAAIAVINAIDVATLTIRLYDAAGSAVTGWVFWLVIGEG
jgi:hypothetical protein